MHEHARRGEERDFVVDAAGGHIPLVGKNAVCDRQASVRRPADTPPVHPLFLPGNRLPGTVFCLEITEMLGVIHDLVITRCPPGQVQHQIVPAGAFVGQVDIQVVGRSIKRNGIGQGIGNLLLPGAGRRKRDGKDRRHTDTEKRLADCHEPAAISSCR